MKPHQILVVIVAFAAVGCNRVKLPSGHSDAPYLSVLEQGLTDQTDVMLFPRGEVQIMSGLSSQMESRDVNQLKFTIQYLEFLQNAQKGDLLTLTERQQGSLQSIGNMGARFFTVAPTPKLLQLQDAKKNKDKFVAVPIGTIKVLEILKDDEYKFPRGAPGDEFRLILGRVRDTPTPQAKALPQHFATTEPQELKFRAILQFNPFAKTYTYVTADVGTPEDATWKTNNVQ